ncbi:hypothetical protein [Longilinea arvoryzae]|nr:hypothetical protein [Longilinea arvoryzae]
MMIGLNATFWMYVVLFALIGGMRGWARELLVSFSVILAMFIINVLERFVPFVRDTLPLTAPNSLFWMRTLIILSLVFFGYQTPKIPRLAESGRFARDRLQDSLLGIFLGAFNGYLIFGSLWFYMNAANYPFAIVTAPMAGTPIGDAAIRLLSFLPPNWLGSPAIYFAVAIAFVFVLVVFI